MNETSPAPLLSAVDLRIDLGTSVAVEHATFVSSGTSLVAQGDGGALVALLLGRASISAGSLQLLGREVGRGGAQQAGVPVGVAPLDPVLPPSSTVREYLVAGGRLAGLRHREADERASATLSELGLSPLAARVLGQLNRGQARSVVLAQAVLTRPSVLIAEAPLAGLAGGEADDVDRVFAAARAGRAWIGTVMGSYPGSPERGMADAADEWVLFSDGRLVQKTAPRGVERRATGYSLMLRGDPTAFARALAERGISLTGGPTRFWLELPAGVGPSEILDLSLEVGAPVVELYPRVLFASSVVNVEHARR